MQRPAWFQARRCFCVGDDRLHVESSGPDHDDRAARRRMKKSSASFRRKGRKTSGRWCLESWWRAEAAARICAPLVGGPVKRCLAWPDRRRNGGQFVSCVWREEIMRAAQQFPFAESCRIFAWFSSVMVNQAVFAFFGSDLARVGQSCARNGR